MSTISDRYLPAGVQRQRGGEPPYLGYSTEPHTAVTRGPRRAPEVLQLGGRYIHCGEPMQAADSGLRSIYGPTTTEYMPTEQTSKGLLEVYLRTRVLRCGCGFQMEIPN